MVVLVVGRAINRKGFVRINTVTLYTTYKWNDLIGETPILTLICIIYLSGGKMCIFYCHSGHLLDDRSHSNRSHCPPAYILVSLARGAGFKATV